jgi:hypothetical protein
MRHVLSFLSESKAYHTVIHITKTINFNVHTSTFISEKLEQNYREIASRNKTQRSDKE